MDNQESLPKPTELPVPLEQSAPKPLEGLRVEAASMNEAAIASGGVATPTAAVQASLPASPAAQNSVAPAQSVAPDSSAHLSAADVDLIEKEWVERAKAIVVATHGDPYTQNKEINKMKADYIKKRYNKDIKVASE